MVKKEIVTRMKGQEREKDNEHPNKNPFKPKGALALGPCTLI
jgi:hypothetical protein